jgi:hypothetical protein
MQNNNKKKKNCEVFCFCFVFGVSGEEARKDMDEIVAGKTVLPLHCPSSFAAFVGIFCQEKNSKARQFCASKIPGDMPCEQSASRKPCSKPKAAKARLPQLQKFNALDLFSSEATGRQRRGR